MQLEIRNAVERDSLLYNTIGFVAGCLITMGTLGDRYGRRRMLLIGAAAFGEWQSEPWRMYLFIVAAAEALGQIVETGGVARRRAVEAEARSDRFCERRTRPSS